MYDDIFSEDILKNPENKLDGTLFRKGRINVSNGASNIHSGDPSEETIVEHINDLIKFMNRKDIPSLLKSSIVHYYFEYIHPFYDGNGRFGRFLFSMYLARKVDIYTGLSLSYSIFEDRKKYAELFLNTSKVKNYGEATFFVIGMLNFIINGQESIIQMLKDKILKLNYAEKYIKSIESSFNLSEIECNILFIYIQNYIFAKENPLPDKELLKYVEGIKSIQTLRRHLDNLIKIDDIVLSDFYINNNLKIFKHPTTTSNIISIIPFNVDGFHEIAVIGQDMGGITGIEVSFKGNATSIKVRIVRLIR